MFPSSRLHLPCVLLSSKGVGIAVRLRIARFGSREPLMGGAGTMTRILAWCVVVASLCATAWAGVNPGSISGYVRNSSGVPQMGATVQLLAATGQMQVAYTDAKGYFSLVGVIPGTYNVHVSAPSFLPTLREDVALAAGASKVLNITLNTLFEAVRMLPPLKKSDDEDDSWKWTLRST